MIDYNTGLTRESRVMDKLFDLQYLLPSLLPQLLDVVPRTTFATAQENAGQIGILANQECE
jgi:hypothetical protein